MKRLALLLAVLLAACGGDGDEGDEGAARAELSFDLSFDEPLRPGPVTWVVTVRNDTDADVELEFSSGQRADVQLLQDGEPVYTWSAARSFIQALGTEVVPAGDAIDLELDDVLEVDPGDYDLVATLTSSSHPLEVRRQVTVESR